MTTAIIVITFFLTSFAIYYFGIKLMSENSQKVFAKRIHVTLCRQYGNDIFKGFLTCILLHSSALFNKIICNFTNSGFFNINKSSNFISGANLGTCVKLLIIALLINFLGLELIIPTAIILLILFFLPTKEKTDNICLIILGLLLILSSIELSTKLIVDTELGDIFRNILSLYTPNSYLSIIAAISIGFIFTTMMQSSSIVIIFTIIFASSNMITFGMGAATVIGANIGSAILPVVFTQELDENSQIVTNRNLFFNVIAAIISLYLFFHIKYFFSDFKSTEIAIAGFHLCFNILTIISARLCKYIISNTTNNNKSISIAYKKTGLTNTSETAIAEFPYFTKFLINSIINNYTILSDLLTINKEKKFCKKTVQFKSNIDDIFDKINDYQLVISKFNQKRLSKYSHEILYKHKKVVDSLSNVLEISIDTEKALEGKKVGRIWFSQLMRENIDNKISQIIDKLKKIILDVDFCKNIYFTPQEFYPSSQQDNFEIEEEVSEQAVQIFENLIKQLDKADSILSEIYQEDMIL